jgi:hypothetical protein
MNEVVEGLTRVSDSSDKIHIMKSKSSLLPISIFLALNKTIKRQNISSCVNESTSSFCPQDDQADFSHFAEKKAIAGFLHLELNLEFIPMNHGCIFTSSLLFDSSPELLNQSIEIETTISSFEDTILSTSQVLGVDELQHIDFVTEFLDSFFNGCQQMTEQERKLAFETISIDQVFRLFEDDPTDQKDNELMTISWDFRVVERYSGLAGE